MNYRRSTTTQRNPKEVTKAKTQDETKELKKENKKLKKALMDMENTIEEAGLESQRKLQGVEEELQKISKELEDAKEREQVELDRQNEILKKNLLLSPKTILQEFQRRAKELTDMSAHFEDLVQTNSHIERELEDANETLSAIVLEPKEPKKKTKKAGKTTKELTAMSTQVGDLIQTNSRLEKEFTYASKKLSTLVLELEDAKEKIASTKKD